MADLNANIGVNIDASDAIAQLKSLQRQIAQFHTSVAKSSEAAALAQRDLQRNFINGVNAIGAFSAELRTVRTTAESFTDSLEKNKFSMRDYFRYSLAATKTFGSQFQSQFDTINKVAIQNVRELQTQYIKMGRDASGAMRAIAIIPNELDMTNLNTQTQLAAQRQAIFNQLVKQGSTNLLNFGKNTQWAGRQLMVGFTLPLASLGMVASRTFMDMETAAIKFRKVYGDLFTPAEETMQALDTIKELGATFTQYGIAVSQTVSLAAEAAAAGFQGLDLQRQVTEATRLQVLGQIDQNKALETTISLQNAFQMSSEDLADAINFLNAVENQTVVSLDDITTAIPKAAPVVKQLGGDVKDLAFFLAAMKEGGVNASEGANALKSGLASLINPTDKASAMLADMGINIEEIVNKNAGNVKQTVIEFAQALDNLSDLNRQRAIEQLFGKFQLARLSTLFENVTKEGNQASRVLDIANASAADLASTAEKELGITAESAMNKFRKAVEDLKVALVPVGEAFLKVVTPIVENIGGFLEKFSNLSEGARKTITTLTVVVGAIAPVLLMTIGLFANFVANGIKGLMLLRNGYLRLSGQSNILGEQTQYLTTEQRMAEAAAHSLEQSHARLTQTFTVEAGAVARLRKEYELALGAATKFATVNPGMMNPRGAFRRYATGVVSVPGPKGAGDIVPAMLSPGEAVIPAEMAQKYSTLISAMIADKIPGFAFGLEPKQVSSAAGYVFAHGQAPTVMTEDQISRLIAAVTSQSQKAALMQATRMTGLTNFGFIAPEALNMGKMTGEAASSFFRNQGELATRKIFETITQIIPAAANDPAFKSDMNLFAQNIADELAKAGTRAVSEPEFYRSVQAALTKTLTQATSSAFAPGMAATRGNVTTVAAYGGPLNREERGQRYAISRAAQQGAFDVDTAATSYKSKSLISTVRKFGGDLALAAAAGVKAAQKSGSDSRIAIGLGEDFSGGYATGIAAGAPEVRVATGMLGNAAAAGLRDTGLVDKYGNPLLLPMSQSSGREAGLQPGQPPIIIPPGGGNPPTPGAPFGPRRPTMFDRTFGSIAGRMRARTAKSPMGTGLGLIGGSMALGATPDFAGKGLLQGALTGGTLGMFLPGPGMAIGAAIGTAVAGFAMLNAKAKETEAILRGTFSSSAEAVSMFGQTLLDSSIKIVSFAEDAKGTKDAFAILNPEIQKLVDQINQLPEDSPLRKLVENISQTDMQPISVAGNILTNVTDAIATGGLDPKNAENYVRAILQAANRTKDFAFVWSIVQKSVGNATDATTKNLDKLSQAVDKNSEAWFYNTNSGEGIAKGYNDLTATQKILSDQMLNLFAITSNGSLKFDDLMARINGVRKSSVNAKVGVAALSAAIFNSGNADAIARLNRIKEIFAQAGESARMSAADVLLFNTVLQTTSEQGLREWAEKNGFAGPASTGLSAPLTTIIREFAKSKDFKDLLSVINQITGAGAGDGGGGGGGAGAEKRLSFFDKELAYLNKKRDALKEINNELDRQNEYQQKQMNLANQATLAKISGNYLQAAMLGQESAGLAASFARESKELQLDKIISLTQARKTAADKRKRLTTGDIKFGKNIMSGNFGAISPLAQTPAGGLNYPVGGTVYNVTMTVSGVQDPEKAADIVVKKLKLEKDKNNKKNKVGR